MKIDSKEVHELIFERDYYREAFNILADLVWLKDIDGVFLKCNKKATQLIGLELDEIIGKTDYDLFKKDRADYFRKVDKEAMFGPKPIVVKEYLSAADGSFRGYFETTKAPMKDNKGNVIGVLGIARDITEIIKKEEELNQRNRMDAVGQLAGGVAHDFNNILGGIIGATELLLNNKNFSEEEMILIRLILTASERAADLTNKLLAFSRKGAIVVTEIDIHSLINETTQFLKNTIDKKIIISMDNKAEYSTVTGDIAGLQSILLNLGINSSHAIKNTGTISYSTSNIYFDEEKAKSSNFNIIPGKYIDIKVKDDGEGISIEDLNKIFEPFFTTKKQGKGTGLGLSSVYGTIQSHNGAIQVYSEIDVGTVFHIYLPCSNHIIKKDISDRKIDICLGTVLLVDDEEVIRVTGQQMLKRMGLNVILAKNGIEAITKFKENINKIDLILIDMIMPEMSGLEAFYKLKEIDENCKIIISSGFTKNNSLTELYQNGLDGFLQKPFKIKELNRIIVEVLNKD